MAWTSTWWRRLGTALAALVLTVLTFGPSLDRLLCHDESSLTAAAAELQPGAVPADLRGTDHADDGLAPCVHGHCHHGSPYVPAAPESAAAPQDVVAPQPPLMRVRVPTSDPKYGLIRPPRA